MLREKLKLIKGALKEWHLMHANNIPAKIETLKKRQSELDDKGEEDGLSTEEMHEMKEVSQNLHSLSRVNTSIIWQQSRLHWLKDGDANSRYFHSILSSRRRRNSIVALMVNESLVEGVQPIRNAVFSHFKDHYAASSTTRPGIEICLSKIYLMRREVVSLNRFLQVKLKKHCGDAIVSRAPDLMG